MKTLKHLFLTLSATAAFALASAPAHAAEWYVDAVNGDDSYDGRTAQTAKKRIQAAVDCAAKNETVKVAEGVYQDENRYSDSISACVVITKNLTLVATGAKDKTHIVGRHADTSTGVGEGAVRCVYVKEKAVARIEGFTIRDGAASSDMGGGVVFSVYDNDNNRERGWLVDCVVSNCVASRGGALQYGTAIRCMFSGNNSTSYGKVASQSILYNCVVVNNIGVERLFNYPRAIVNCTIARNKMNDFGYSASNHHVYNTIFLENQTDKFYQSKAVLSNCLITTNTASFNRTDSSMCATNYTGTCFVAPVLGDWRPRVGSGAAALGDAAHLALVELPDESMRYVDYAGNSIPDEGAITCGAFQEVVTPESGTLFLKGSYEIAGSGVADTTYCNYLHATNYPCMFKLKAVDATISNIVWYSSSTGLSVRVPTMDGWVGVMAPPEGMLTLKPIYASKVVYADAMNGDDSYEGEDKGSWEHPFKTLQAAYDALPNGSSSSPKYSIICAKPGDYHEGGKEGNTITRRMYIDGNKRVRVVALGGPQKTIIRGCSAAESLKLIPYGCLYMNVPSLVQGFTLTGGHSTDSSDESAASAGAALCCAVDTSDRVIADCIVSNNVSSFSAQRGGLSVRCVFLDNTEMRAGGGDIRSGYTAHSVFRTGIDSHKDAYALGNSTRAYFATYKGTVHDNAVRASVLAATASCRFIDMSSDDYRLRSDSPAFGAGDADPEKYWKYANLDMMGNPLSFIEGCPTAGAYQQPSAIALAVDAGSGTLSVGGSASLTNTVMPESSVTITKAADCGRNLIGFMLQDGTYSEGSSYTYTAPSVFSVGQVECIDAVFSTNWYVNATLGDDTNDGYTPETPKKTLKGAMTAAVIPGDAVHAAPGDYCDGEMLHSKNDRPNGGETVIGTRVVVPKGVSLVSVGGPDVTHIIGASASAEYDVRGLGLGSNAVRCVFLSAGARLKGFTLRNGRTNGNSAQENSAFGGGVLGVGSELSFVEDCVISNCMAMYGAAGYSANFKRCRIFHNRAVVRSSATRSSSHDSCIADCNQGDHPFDYYVMITNCTIGANWKESNGSEGHCLVYPNNMDNACVVDSLVLGRIHPNVRMRRSAARSGSGVKAEKCEDCILTNQAALAVDENYRPRIGENAAIDVIPLADEDASVRTERDVYGVQRVFNGARDLGALDADWRGHYAKTLGGSRITVTEVDPAVVEENGKIQIPEGKLELAWRVPEGRQIKHTMGLAVNGSGVLSVTKNGTEYADVSEGTSGAYSFTAGGTTMMTFAYNPDVEGDGYAEIGGFSAPIGTVLSIR